MSDRSPIPVPFAHRVRRFRRRALPGISFVLSVVMAGWLWQHQVELPHAVGEVEALQMQVEARVSGQFIPLAERSTGQWQLFDRVIAGQVIGAIDNVAVSDALRQSVRQMEELSRQLQHVADGMVMVTEPDKATTGSDSESVDTTTADRALWDAVVRFEKLQLEKCIYRANFHRHRMQLLRLPSDDSTDAGLVSTDLPSSLSLDMAASELEGKTRAELTANLSFLQRAAEGAEQELAQILELHGDSPEFTQMRVRLTAPLRTALHNAQSAMEAQTRDAERSELRSPLTGFVVKIGKMPGQGVDPGQPVLTVAADQSQYVISYLSETYPVLPTAGSSVMLRLRNRNRAAHLSIVENVGPQVQEIPNHLTADSRTQQWGIPVRIKLPPDLAALPGSLLDVTFRPVD